MENTILITANWHTGALSQQTISRQYDNNRYVVQFVGYPEASEGNELDYYLLVWMSSAPGEKPDEIAPIQLASDQWHISNVFTQQTQQIKFQMCALNTEGTFEAHSPIFTGFVRSSLEHDGTAQDIDVSTLFDAYREYLNELIIRAGAVIIDPAPTQGSTNAVSSGGVWDEVTSLKEDLSNYEDITASRSHNILPFESTQNIVNNVSVHYGNGKMILKGTANNSGGRLIKITELTLPSGTYGWHYSVSSLSGIYISKVSDNTIIPSETISGRFKKFTLSEETAVYIGISVKNGKSYDETIDIMISDDITKLYWSSPVQSAKDDVARAKIDEILSDQFYVKATQMTLEWENGGISSNGNYNTNTNRLRTKYIIPVPLKMAVSGNYRFICVQYDKNFNFIAHYPSAYVAEVNPNDLDTNTAYIRFVLKRIDDASIDVSEGNNLIATGIEDVGINTKKDIALAIYGDSISTFSGWIPSENRVEYSGSTHSVTNVNQTWWKKIIDYYGYNLLMNNSWSGRCVSTLRDAESGNLNSGGCEQANIDVIGQNGEPDIIIVELGTNDINRSNILGLGVWSGNPIGNVSDDSVADSELTSFSECYARMLYRIHTTYPKAIVYCCTVMPQKRASINGWTQITQDNKTLAIWNEKIKEIASISGCRIIDFCTCGNTWFNADIVFGDGATHPNGVGFLNMFEIAKKALVN